MNDSDLEYQLHLARETVDQYAAEAKAAQLLESTALEATHELVQQLANEKARQLRLIRLLQRAAELIPKGTLMGAELVNDVALELESLDRAH